MAKAKVEPIDEAKIKAGEPVPFGYLHPVVEEPLYTEAKLRHVVSTLHKLSMRLPQSRKEKPLREDVDNAVETISALTRDHAWAPYFGDSPTEKVINWATASGKLDKIFMAASVAQDDKELPARYRIALLDASIQLNMLWAAMREMGMLLVQREGLRSRLQRAEAKLALLEPGENTGAVNDDDGPGIDPIVEEQL